MNPLPPNADELVSAYLDGEAAPDEVVIVESSPELMSRVDELRAVSGGLAVPVVAPAAQKETHISAALDAFDALFASADAAGDLAPTLASVATVSTTSEPVDTPEAAANRPAAGAPTVHSLEAARERRRPRRFNAGVIAAAAAILVLFVAAATLTFGRGNNSESVATSADSVAAAEVATDTTSAGSANAEAASDDAVDVAENALSELDAEAARAPQGTPAPPAAALQASEADEEPAEEEAMADEAAGDDADDADDGFAAAEDAAADDDDEGESETQYFLGNFDTRDQLKVQLDLAELEVSIEELLAGATEFEPGIIPTCRDEIPELADTQPDEVRAEAFIADEQAIATTVIYVLTNPDGTRDVYVVDSQDCTLISVLEDQ